LLADFRSVYSNFCDVISYNTQFNVYYWLFQQRFINNDHLFKIVPNKEVSITKNENNISKIASMENINFNKMNEEFNNDTIIDRMKKSASNYSAYKLENDIRNDSNNGNISN
jgi:hypothetical protein